MPPKPWPKQSSTHLDHLILFRPRIDRLTNPRNGQTFDRLVLETCGWVNVVALTAEGQAICVRQYRFGVERETLEIPGGAIDPGEHPLTAARRELREETGFTSEKWSYLGHVQANPAFLDNLCHHYLAEDCVKTHGELELDPGEDLVVEELPLADLVQAALTGEVGHSLAVCALARVAHLTGPWRGPAAEQSS